MSLYCMYFHFTMLRRPFILIVWFKGKAT